MRLFPLLLAGVLLGSQVVAQSTVVIPSGASQSVSGTSALDLPFASGQAVRLVDVYSAANFTTQGIDFPIQITRVRYRPQETQSAAFLQGASIPSFRASLSTSRLAFGSAVLANAGANPLPFADVVGSDGVEVFTSGMLTIGGFDGRLTPAGVPEPWHVDLDTGVTGTGASFVYDPGTGRDLAIELQSSGLPSGVSAPFCDGFVNSAGVSRVQNALGAPFTSANSSRSVGLVAELTYTPSPGLYPRFDQDATTGLLPLRVTFTDRSVSDDPAGIQQLRFDFDSDGIFDASVSRGGSLDHVYGACGADGTFDVTLEASDLLNGTASLTKTDAVVVAPLSLEYTQDATQVGAGQIVNFSATVSPGAVVSWDFDGDGVVEASGVTAAHAFPAAGVYTVIATATNQCNVVTESSTIEVLDEAVLARPGPSGELAFWPTPNAASYFDVHVSSTGGYLVRGIWHRSMVTDEIHSIEVYAQTVPGRSVVGNEDPSNFTLLATGSGVSSAVGGELFPIDVIDFVLPPGLTGLAVVTRGFNSGSSWFERNGGLTSQNSDIAITPQNSFFSFALATNGIQRLKSWSGGLSGVGIDGLIPDFVASVTNGASPLGVLFSDRSQTNSPGGITSWGWDFQGDGVVDSTLQFAFFSYTQCGDFDVALTVTDAINGSRTVRKPDFISTDTFSASFSQDKVVMGTNGMLGLSYTGDAGATIAWDWDSDGVADASGLTATASYPAPGAYTITMTASRRCRTEVVTSTVRVFDGAVIEARPGLTGVTFARTQFPSTSYFDLFVHEPAGLTISQLLFRGDNTQLHEFEVYAMFGQTTQAQQNASNFTLVATGQGTPSVPGELFPVDITDFGVPQGVTGLAVVTRSGSHVWYSGNGTFQTSDPSVILTVRSGSTSFDNNGATFPSSSFSGGLVYRVGGGSAWQIGDGCPGALGVPGISLGGVIPRVGVTVPIQVSNVPDGVQLHGGVSRTFNARFGIPLPVDLGLLLGAQTGCGFQVSSELILAAVPDAAQQASFSITIPNNPQLAGQVAYLQGLVFDAAAQGAVVTSDAMALVIGS